MKDKIVDKMKERNRENKREKMKDKIVCVSETYQLCDDDFLNRVEHLCKHFRLPLLGHSIVFVCVCQADLCF